MRAGRRWTLEEGEFVLARLCLWRVETIARHLGRTPRAVRRWLERNHQAPTLHDLVTSGQASASTGYTPQALTAMARAGRQCSSAGSAFRRCFALATKEHDGNNGEWWKHIALDVGINMWNQ